MKVALCVPARDKIDVHFFQFYMELTLHLQKQGYEVIPAISSEFPVDAARNDCLKIGALARTDYYLWIDSDMSMHPVEKIDHLFRFIKEHPGEIVSGVYFHKSYPYTPVIRKMNPVSEVYEQENRFEDVPWEVDGFGFGMVLMDREGMTKVFNATKGKPFLYSDKMSEDLHFCQIAKFKLGIKLWVHPEVDCVHHGGYVSQQNFLFVKDNKPNGYIELAEYLKKPLPWVFGRCEDAAQAVAEEWRLKDPKTEEEVLDFYRKTENYVFDCTMWWVRNMHERKRMLTQVVKGKAKEVLEYGCGIGDYGLWFAEQCGSKVDFYDICQPSLRYLAWRIGRRKLASCAIVDDPAKLKGKYDYIVCLDVLEHVKDPLRELERMRALLKDDGILIAVVAPLNPGQPQHIAELDLEKNGFKAVGLNMYQKVLS